MNTNEKNVEVLFVEDNSNDIELTIRAFGKNDLLNKIFVVKDGVEALDFLFREGAFKDLSEIKGLKLILLDLKMPKIGGLEVLEKIKKDMKTKHIPVIILSSSKEESDIINAYQSGANSYLVKPVNYEKFVNMIRHISSYWLQLNETVKLPEETIW